MCKLHWMAVLLCVVAVGCDYSTSPEVAKPNKNKRDSAHRVGGFVVGAPITHANLTIFPVSTTAPKNDDRFITLDEGLKNGTVEILEVGAANGESALDAPNPRANDAPNALPAQERYNGDELQRQGPALPQPPEPAADNASNGCQDEVQQVNEASQIEIVEQLEFDNEQFDNLNPQLLSQNAGNQVNQLMVVNKSDKPLYLMPGEIIIGGSQDRTIGRELVIQPNSQPVPIDVYCVEHGRWNQRDTAQTTAFLTDAASGEALAGSIAIAENGVVNLNALAMQANDGKFIASVGQLSKAARLAVQADKDQGKVWAEVANENAKSGVQVESGAFTANYVDASNVRRLEPYLEQLQERITAVDNVVGVIVAINGKVESMDVFESTPLFKKLWPKLLKSYVLDAANGFDEDLIAIACPRSDACNFMREATVANVDESEVDGGLALTRRSNERLMSFSLEESADAAMPSAGFGGSVHSSAFAH